MTLYFSASAVLRQKLTNTQYWHFTPGWALMISVSLLKARMSGLSLSLPRFMPCFTWKVRLSVTAWEDVMFAMRNWFNKDGKSSRCEIVYGRALNIKVQRWRARGRSRCHLTEVTRGQSRLILDDCTCILPMPWTNSGPFPWCHVWCVALASLPVEVLHGIAW